MYDIVFYYTKGYPESEIEKTKNKFPSAHFIQIGNDQNFVMSAKRISKEIKTSMFWLIPIEVNVDKFILKYKVPEWDVTYVHYEKYVLLDLFLIPKDHNFTDEQFEKKFFNNIKFVEFNLFSRRSYDIIFYYTEGYPESEIEKTKSKFPSAHFIQIGNDRNFVMSAKRIIKDIKTSMFWLIPIEVNVDKFILKANVDEFILKYDIPVWDVPYVYYEKLGTLDLFLIPKDHNFTDDQFEKKFFNDVKFIEFNLFSRCVYDIFFISYNEPSAETNFQLLKKRFPEVKRVKDVKGIFKAHLEAAKNSSTNFFWVVDADAEVVEKFNFSYEVPPWDFDVTHIWKSANLVNGLSYGNGGVKLFPKHLFFQADEESIDVSTSIGYKIKVVDEISNINNFATDEFSAWRSAFRECTKLSAKVIYGHVDKESEQRLTTWRNFASGKFKSEILSGAAAGYAYGRKNMGNPSALLKINDFDWLKEQFLLKDQLSEVGPLNINVAESKAASVMGYISGTTLTVSAMISGTIHAGMLVSNSTRMSSSDEMIEPGTEIISGTGAFWKVSVSQKKGSQDSPININIY